MGGGFTKSVMPPPGSPDTQAEYFKEVKKAGWDGDRAHSEIRKNIVEDSEGRKYVNTPALPKTS